MSTLNLYTKSVEPEPKVVCTFSEYHNYELRRRLTKNNNAVRFELEAMFLYHASDFVPQKPCQRVKDSEMPKG